MTELSEEEETELLEWLEEVREKIKSFRESKQQDEEEKKAPDDAHWLEQWLTRHHNDSLDFNKLSPQQRTELRIINESRGGTTDPDRKRKGKLVIDGQFPHLIQLSLGNNLITELVVKNLPELKYLTISHNLLTKLKIENCPNITDIYTHHNQFTDETFPKLEQFPKLENVTFYDAHYQPKKKVKDCSEEEEPNDPNYKGNYLSPAKVSELEQYCQSKGIKLECKPFFSLLSQEERERADLIIRALKYYKRDEEDEETMDEEEFTPEELEIFKNITKIDLNELIHSEGRKRINGHLYLDHFPNLETLICNNQGLIGELELNLCPELKFVYCNDNQIEEINLTGLDNLEYLYCSNNKFSIMEDGEEIDEKGITQLDLTHTPNLKLLQCDNNLIRELNVKHLVKLESLKCFHCNLAELDVSGLKNLKELYCACNYCIDWNNPEILSKNLRRVENLKKRVEKKGWNRRNIKRKRKIGLIFRRILTDLNLQGCESLEILDCAENGLEELDISNLTKLRTVSCRETDITNINATNCKRLEYINYSRQNRMNEITFILKKKKNNTQTFNFTTATNSNNSFYLVLTLTSTSSKLLI